MNVPLEELDELFGQPVALHLQQLTVADANASVELKDGSPTSEDQRSVHSIHEAASQKV